jgi:hypothetical protein
MRNFITLSCLSLAVAIFLAIDGGTSILHQLKQDPLLSISQCLNYVGLATTTALTLRISSFIAGLCSVGMTLNSEEINWTILALKVPVVCLAGYSTYLVVSEALIPSSLSPKENKLYIEYFQPHGLTKREFYQLLKCGAQWKTTTRTTASATSNDTETNTNTLTVQGQGVHEFVLITSGTFVVIVDGEEIAELQSGSLVGETSFVRHVDPGCFVTPVATATVESQSSDSTYIAWDAKALHFHLNAKNGTGLKACIMTIIAAAQADKLEEKSKHISRRKSRENKYKRQITTFS